MADSEFLLPDVGEGLTEAEIVDWKVKAGDTVAINQVLVEIETAKSLVELPSPFAGTVSALLVREGDTVDVGTADHRGGDDGRSLRRESATPCGGRRDRRRHRREHHRRGEGAREPRRIRRQGSRRPPVVAGVDADRHGGAGPRGAGATRFCSRGSGIRRHREAAHPQAGEGPRRRPGRTRRHRPRRRDHPRRRHPARDSRRACSATSRRRRGRPTARRSSRSRAFARPSRPRWCRARSRRRT